MNSHLITKAVPRNRVLRWLNSPIREPQSPSQITSPGVKAYTVIFEIKETLCQDQVELRACPFRSDSNAAMGTCKAEVLFEFGFQIKVPEVPSCNLLKPVKEVVETVAATCEGCPLSASLDNPLVKASVELALKIFNDENKKKRTFALSKIIYAIKEVVIGERYWVYFQIQETECQEDRSKLWSDCPLKAVDEAVIGDCYTEVLFPVGATKGQMRGFPKCQLIQLIVDEDADALPCIGCLQPLKTNDPRVHRTVEHAISKFNNKSGQLFKFALTRVLSAEHEEVSRNGTDSLEELQPEEPLVSEPTIKTPAESATEHPTELPAEAHNSEKPMIFTEEPKLIAPIEITDSDVRGVRKETV
uniref:kininogen-1-like isoform X4 n=1 Tax=Pristiophorus japonicus TaxID=55135 RepID=UPI00398EAB3E